MKPQEQSRAAVFGHAAYIRATDKKPVFSYHDPLPFFRKTFCFTGKACRAELLVQAPSFARIYLNGTPVTEDIFYSATSDYDKILWYDRFDVTALLREGENVLGVIAGNGFFNEPFVTAWDYDTAPWRDAPQFLLCLRVDTETLAVSDESWRCSLSHSHITFSHLRCGEHVDMRKYDPVWLHTGFDDSTWSPALPRTAPVTAKLLPTPCQPVRECARIAPVALSTAQDGALIADFGQTISGYAEITLCEAAGTEILFDYAEELDASGSPKHNGMDGKHYYPETPFQHCRMIASGGKDSFKPTFFYAGFRYLRIKGLTQPPRSLCAIFTHQDVARRADFSCGSEVLNYIYRAGVRSTYSNLFWCLTDCPTREKLGWTNDAQASTEQVLINFDILPLFEKWYEDIKASMYADGSLHGTIPSTDWAWGHGCGPVCDCLLFEMPYRVYLYTGDAQMLLDGIPYFERYIAFLEGKLAAGHRFTLGDWKSNDVKCPELTDLIARCYLLGAYDTTALAKRLAKADPTALEEKARVLRARLAVQYLDSEGACVLPMQTAIALLLHFGVAEDPAALERQLLCVIEKNGYQLRAGMVGFQYIYNVLHAMGRGDVAYRLLSETEPGYKTWAEYGESTLWECWDGENNGSHNHHMYSGVIAWLYRALLGLAPMESAPGFERLELRPLFLPTLSHAQGFIDTVRGRIVAKWVRTNAGFDYTVTVPPTVTATFDGQRLVPGENLFHVKN